MSGAARPPDEGEEEEEEDKSYQRDPRRRLRHFLRRWVKRPLLSLVLWLIPPIYLAYCRFVWWTSRIDDRVERLHGIIRDHDGTVGLLWHEEVFTVAWAYRDFHPHTLASVGDAGEAITRLLERCSFTVFRGGSARKRSRRIDVLGAMIDHMKTTREVIYGITVDGSVGPRYRMKNGGIAIAKECRKPVILMRTWYKRRFRLPTWDRMAVPLPFNRIVRVMRGPYHVPEDAEQNSKALTQFRRYLEKELCELAAETYKHFGQRVPAALAEVMVQDAAIAPTAPGTAPRAPS